MAAAYTSTRVSSVDLLERTPDSLVGAYILSQAAAYMEQERTVATRAHNFAVVSMLDGIAAQVMDDAAHRIGVVLD